LNGAAKELNFHYIGTVQLNRTVEADKIASIDDIKKTRPTRSAIKNSGAYLERARTTIALWRPMYFAKEYLQEEEYAEMTDMIHFQVLKSNNNDIAERKMLFVPETFDLLSTDAEENGL
jgi:replicative DNA helicase